MNPIVWSCGLGINSAAILVGLVEHGERYDLAMFADTGGERQATYAYLPILNEYAERHGLPSIMRVWKKMPDNSPAPTLEQYVTAQKALPSIAYGLKSCSDHYKIQPQRKVINDWQPAVTAWEHGEKVTMLIGFDASEGHRTLAYDTKKYFNRYPLVEWDWDRDDCLAAIIRAGLPVPPKSSCFFCPNMRPSEIRDLMDTEPDKLERALEIERNAGLVKMKGLGRSFSWANVAQAKREQLPMFPEPPDISCACIG